MSGALNIWLAIDGDRLDEAVLGIFELTGKLTLKRLWLPEAEPLPSFNSHLGHCYAQIVEKALGKERLSRMSAVTFLAGPTCGSTFDAWRDALHALAFEHGAAVRVVNAVRTDTPALPLAYQAATAHFEPLCALLIDYIALDHERVGELGLPIGEAARVKNNPNTYRVIRRGESDYAVLAPSREQKAARFIALTRRENNELIDAAELLHAGGPMTRRHLNCVLAELRSAGAGGESEACVLLNDWPSEYFETPFVAFVVADCKQRLRRIRAQEVRVTRILENVA